MQENKKAEKWRKKVANYSQNVSFTNKLNLSFFLSPLQFFAYILS